MDGERWKLDTAEPLRRRQGKKGQIVFELRDKNKKSPEEETDSKETRGWVGVGEGILKRWYIKTTAR